VEQVGASGTPQLVEETETEMSTTTTPQLHARVSPTAESAEAGRKPLWNRRQPLWKQGVAASLAAAVTTTVLAALASAAGVTFADRSGASIPISGFSQLTLVFSLAGVGIAALMSRKARRPHRTFVRTAVAMTVLSFVPDLTFGFAPTSAATLIMLHTVAAAIVVPTLARRLASNR
jgi:Family of unknown function (DUF6069)